ncbi:hypothetical protein D3C74_463240 [compost metagenome]
MNHRVERLILNGQCLHRKGMQTNQLLQTFGLILSHVSQPRTQSVSKLGTHLFQLFIFIEMFS